MTAQLDLGSLRLSSIDVALPSSLKPNHAVSLGILDAAAENGGAESAPPLRAQLNESGAVKDVVAEDQRRRPIANELAADDESLGEAVRRGLLGIGSTKPP